MSAPAIKLSGLPLITTADFTLSSLAIVSSAAPNSATIRVDIVFTFSPGTSRVRIATLPSLEMLKQPPLAEESRAACCVCGAAGERVAT